METVREIITLSSSRHCGTFILKFNKFKSVKKQIWFVVFSVFYWTLLRPVVTCVDHKQHRACCVSADVFSFYKIKVCCFWKCVKLNVFFSLISHQNENKKLIKSKRAWFHCSFLPQGSTWWVFLIPYLNENSNCCFLKSDICYYFVFCSFDYIKEVTWFRREPD